MKIYSLTGFPSALTGSFTGSFFGDGSGLTGTDSGSWDGDFVGSAKITGSLSLSGSFKDQESSPGTAGQVLSSTVSGSQWVDAADSSAITGAGTTGTITKWTTGGSVIGDSIITEAASAITVSGAVTLKDLNVIDTYANDPLIKLAANTSGNAEVQIRTATTSYNPGIGIVTSGYDFNLFTANTPRLTLTSGGIITVGSQPAPPWISGRDIIQLGDRGNINAINSSGNIYINNNIYVLANGNNASVKAGGASQIRLSDNDILFYTSNVASAANEVITLTPKLTISSGGEIQVGGDAALVFGTNNATDPYIQAASSGDELFFGRANGFQMAIRSDNVVDFKTGIRFINGGNTTLNAYEEGDWTSVLSSSSGITNFTDTYSRYTVIGNQVTLYYTFTINFTTANARSYAVLNLPFNQRANASSIGGSVSCEQIASPYRNSLGTIMDASNGDANRCYIAFWPPASGNHVVEGIIVYEKS